MSKEPIRQRRDVSPLRGGRLSTKIRLKGCRTECAETEEEGGKHRS